MVRALTKSLSGSTTIRDKRKHSGRQASESQGSGAFFGNNLAGDPNAPKGGSSYQSWAMSGLALQAALYRMGLLVNYSLFVLCSEQSGTIQNNSEQVGLS